MEILLALVGGSMVPHLIVFSEKGLQGRHWHIFGDVPHIGAVSFTWDDNISSFVILAGHWRFFRDRDFAFPLGQPLGPGVYPAPAEQGVLNDAVSSIRMVADLLG